MTKYEVVYFNARGRAELIRQIFVVAGIEFEDHRMKDGEWPTLKSTAPFGQAPFLKIDGEVALGQSLTIARFLARRFNLAGESELDQAKADMIVDCVEDFLKPLMTAFFAEDETAKAAGKKKFKEEQMPVGLEKFEKLLADNKTQSGFFVGDKITWCDIHFGCMLCVLETFELNPCFEKYPKIKEFKGKLAENEKLKAWIDSRPETKF